jgi:hypothetical protein
MRDRARAHLVHDVRAVNLDRAFAQAEIDGDDLVRLAVDDERHDFAFARCERVEAALEIGVLLQLRAILCVLLECAVDAVDQVLIAKRFLQKVVRAVLHRLHGHRNVAVPSDEDDRHH